MAAECGMKLYKTSVKEDLNVDLVFQHLAENYVKKVTWLTIIQTCIVHDVLRCLEIATMHPLDN